MKIAIIGGGASALMCAINIKQNNDITIFCKDEKLGKKILVTGNGRCNLTNINIGSDSYNVNLDSYFKKFNNLQTIKFFNNIGLETYYDEEGRVYPISNSALSVCDVLNREVKNKNIKVLLNEEVVSIMQNESQFDILTTVGSYNFDKVIICTGSVSCLLDKLNIKYVPFLPSLVALKTREDTKRLAGLKLSNVLVMYKDKFEFGEVLFKDRGLSGICIFNISSYLARDKNYNSKLYIDLLPQIDENKLLNKIKNRKKLNVNNFNEFLDGLFHKEINRYLLKISGFSGEEKIEKITEKDLLKLAKNIKKLEFNITGFYNNNQINCGGIKLEDLTGNLEHKKIKNLYFAGEIIDVDGKCGGYNLQWAWTSGKIIGDVL